MSIFNSTESARAYFEKNLVFYSKYYEGSLIKPVEYALNDGGKRVRPVIMLLTADLLGLSPEKVMPYAAALEFIHNYSLIHDDLPEMDNDPVRRGKPSVQAEFGAGMALLAGDLLLSAAGEILADNPSGASSVITAAACLMVNGQAEETALSLENCTEEGVFGVYRKKTGALISASFIAPYIINEEIGYSADFELSELTDIAAKVGQIFQLVDDVLDARDGRDAGKPTYVNAFGTEKTEKLITELDGDVLAFFKKYGVSDSVLCKFLAKLAYRLN